MATTIDLGKIRLQWKGDYSNATSYELLDVVKFKGDSYVFISTIAAANKTPDTTSEWDLMVSGGDQWSTGTSVPTGGNPGDMYLKTDDEKVYTNTAGSWGVVGDMGGSRWTSGTSAPSGGEDGDFYLKTDDEKVYERVSGSWVVKLDIGGGVWTSSTSNGTGGESGDWHVNTATKDIQENVSGTWTTRVNLSVSGTNLSDLANVPALDSGKFLTNDGTNTSWATVDVTGASVGGDVTGTVGNIQIAANAVTDTELNSAKLNGIASGAEVNPSFKTVGGTSILGSGDIATLPSGGTIGQVVTNTGSGLGGWADAVTRASTAPSSPTPGDQWFDTVSTSMKVWSGAEWAISSPGVFEATGGNSTRTSGGYKYHIFTTSGVFTNIGRPGLVDVFMVAGGGGAGGNMGGGGGAGGLRTITGLTASGVNTVNVGAGGSGAVATGTSGTNSSVFNQDAIGGGGGGGGSNPPAWHGLAGGSGGGGGGYNGGNSGAGTSGQGYAGGAYNGQYYSGGGGGAGAIGATGSRGHGGVGALNDWTGTSYYFAGGGGGGGYTTTGGNGGNGGGGGGAVGTTTGGSGINPGSAGGGGSAVTNAAVPGGSAGANTGGGGGGGQHSTGVGGNGGSGIVIIRYAV
jgi:hypothetical protein